jgi:hypothetical protein
MAKYFDHKTLEILAEGGKQIVEIRNRVAKKTSVDILDTDAISSLSIYEIVSQYDKDYNINFARNGEDAKSKDILIEQKATRVSGPLTKTGRLKKGAGTDAAFQFHAMGDLDYPRYIFVARDKDDLSVKRIYDISENSNRQKVLNHLLSERNLWLERGKLDPKAMKRDVILLPEIFILNNLTFKDKMIISNCIVHKD